MAWESFRTVAIVSCGTLIGAVLTHWWTLFASEEMAECTIERIILV